MNRLIVFVVLVIILICREIEGMSEHNKDPLSICMQTNSREIREQYLEHIKNLFPSPLSECTERYRKICEKAVNDKGVFPEGEQYRVFANQTIALIIRKLHRIAANSEQRAKSSHDAKAAGETSDVTTDWAPGVGPNAPVETLVRVRVPSLSANEIASNQLENHENHKSEVRSPEEHREFTSEALDEESINFTFVEANESCQFMICTQPRLRQLKNDEIRLAYVSAARKNCNEAYRAKELAHSKYATLFYRLVISIKEDSLQILVPTVSQSTYGTAPPDNSQTEESKNSKINPN